MKKYHLILIFLLQILPLMATEKPILKVINETEENLVYSIYLNLDLTGEILSFKIKNGSQIDVYLFQRIIEGFAILKMEVKEILYLECANCSSSYGGELMIRFLKNGITNLYSEIFLYLEKRNGEWGFFKSGDLRPINYLELKSNKLLGKVIGIKEIEIK